MEHVVFSAAPGAGDTDGPATEEFRRVASLEEAVRVVEHLRNDLGITEASVFALTPVPLAFRTYYRVEVPGVADVAAPEEVAPALEPLPTSAELPPLELPPYDAAPEPVVEEAGDFSFDAATGMTVMSSELESDLATEDVPSLLPSASAIPPSRSDAEAEHSLGYFSR
jgi:hypothetical protein